MKSFIIYEYGTDENIIIPQNGLKTWLAGNYLTYYDFKAWFYVEDKSWSGYLKVLAKLYKDLINQLNNFEYGDYIEWDGYDMFDTEFNKPVQFAIGGEMI